MENGLHRPLIRHGLRWGASRSQRTLTGLKFMVDNIKPPLLALYQVKELGCESLSFRRSMFVRALID